MTRELGTRFKMVQHGRGNRLNRSVNKNLAAGEIVTSPSITISCLDVTTAGNNFLCWKNLSQKSWMHQTRQTCSVIGPYIAAFVWLTNALMEPTLAEAMCFVSIYLRDGNLVKVTLREIEKIRIRIFAAFFSKWF